MSLKLKSNKDQEYLPYDEAPKLEELTLDRLYTIATELGKLEIGASFGSQQDCELRLNFTGKDYVNLKECRSNELKVNLSRLIQRAYKFAEFYGVKL